MTPRRFPIACMIFTLSLAFAVLLSWRATWVGVTSQSEQKAPKPARRTARFSPAQTQPGTILRTLVYHEITASPISVEINNGQPRLSKNGNRALFIVTPAAFNPRLRIINFDGSGERELDAAVQPVPNSDSFGVPEISADGGRIVYTANFRANSGNSSGYTIVDVGANAGGDRKRVFAYHSGGAPGRARISGDGNRIFCDTAGSGGLFLPNGTQLSFGVHAFNAADGSYLRQVVTAQAIAQLFGVTPASLSHSDLSLNSLSVSHDGSRIAFVLRINGEHVAFSVNFDGSGLVSLLGPTLAEARQFLLMSVSAAMGRRSPTI